MPGGQCLQCNAGFPVLRAGPGGIQVRTAVLRTGLAVFCALVPGKDHPLQGGHEAEAQFPGGRLKELFREGFFIVLQCLVEILHAPPEVLLRQQRLRLHVPLLQCGSGFPA